MPIQTRIDGDLVVLSNLGRLMDDPRHFDAARDVQALLDEGHRAFVIELGHVRELGTSALGLLVTLTRLVRRHDGEVVLARLTPELDDWLDSMKLDDYWDRYDSVDEAAEALRHPRE
jgi:anti-sigma B factor antagonist